MPQQRFRQLMDGLWDLLWSAGITNPLTVVEYVAGLLLLQSEYVCPETLAKVRSAATRRESTYCSHLMSEIVSANCVTAASAELWADTALLMHALDRLDILKENESNNTDFLGDCFEHVLSHLNSAGHFGQFRTPEHIVQFLVELVSPLEDEIVLDPACGTGTFLIAAHSHRHGKRGAYLGDECDHTIARIAAVNLKLHRVSDALLRKRDALGDLSPEADVILTNPPFAGNVLKGRAADLGLITSKSELLFLELMLRRLKPGGRAASVVPFSVLTSTSLPAVRLREKLVERNRVRAIIELPPGVFRPYTDVKTALVVWERRPPGEKVILLRARSDGYSLDDRRLPVADNDLPMLLDILCRQDFAAVNPNYAQAVERSELRDQGYDLNPSRYLSREASGTAHRISAGHAIESAMANAGKLKDVLTELKELAK